MAGKNVGRVGHNFGTENGDTLCNFSSQRGKGVRCSHDLIHHKKVVLSEIQYEV